MEAINAMVLGRIIERSLIVAGGILALWLGYRLFSIVASDKSSAEMSGRGFAIKLQRVGPGIFFALFGSLVLGYSLYSQISIGISDLGLKSPNTENKNGSIKKNKSQITIKGIGDTKETSIPPSLKAVNTILNIAERHHSGSEKISGADLQLFRLASPSLTYFQKEYINRNLGDGVYETIMAIKKECKKNTSVCQSYLNNSKNSEIYKNVNNILGEMIK